MEWHGSTHVSTLITKGCEQIGLFLVWRRQGHLILRSLADVTSLSRHLVLFIIHRASMASEDERRHRESLLIRCFEECDKVNHAAICAGYECLVGYSGRFVEECSLLSLLLCVAYHNRIAQASGRTQTLRYRWQKSLT